jgi:hypothetical protein
VSGDRHLASHIFNLIVLVVGIVALAALMHELGLADAEEVLSHAGAWFPLILALDLTSMCFDAAAIHAFMRPEQRMVSYPRVLAAQASGRAISLLTPGGALGEATKITMLVGHAPRARVVSAIVLYNLASLYLSVAILVVGVPLTLTMVHLPGEIAVVVWVGLALVLPLVALISVIVHRGAVGTVLDAAAGIHAISRERAARWKTKLVEIDKHLRELHTDRGPGTKTGFLYIGISRVVTWTATAVMLHAIGATVTAELLVGVWSVGVLIGWVAALVPFGIGIADGANFALYDVLGATGAHGLFATMLDRARRVAVSLIGLSAMGVAHALNRISIARRHRHIAELREQLIR